MFKNPQYLALHRKVHLIIETIVNQIVKLNNEILAIKTKKKYLNRKWNWNSTLTIVENNNCKK